MNVSIFFIHPVFDRVAVVGNVDAGKSTLLGVLTHGELDNGRGFARMKLFRHKHEMESGRTSSVGNDILGFDSMGNVVNKPDTHGKKILHICVIYFRFHLHHLTQRFSNYGSGPKLGSRRL